MMRVDGSLPGGGLTAETLALRMDAFPVPGEEGYPAVETGSLHDLVSGFERWIVASADRVGSARANISDDEINGVAQYFDGLLEQSQDDLVARARLIRAGMILAQPSLLSDPDGGRQERLDEVTLLASEYATAERGDQVIRTGVHRYWDRLPSGIDGGLLEAPLSFHIGARGHHSNHNRNFAFCLEGAIPDVPGNSSGGRFMTSVPQEPGYGYGGYPHVGHRQIERVVRDIDASLRSGKDAFLDHARLVVALSGMRGPERGESLDVLDEYFNAGQTREYLEWYNGYQQNPRTSFGRTLSLGGQVTVHHAVAAMTAMVRRSQTQTIQ